MAEKEYIEREAAEELISQPITMSLCLTMEECLAKRSQRDIDVALLRSIPAADVRPVVLCRDCIHARRYTNKIKCGYWSEQTASEIVCDDDFCSYGEKRGES